MSPKAAAWALSFRKNVDGSSETHIWATSVRMVSTKYSIHFSHDRASVIRLGRCVTLGATLKASRSSSHGLASQDAAPVSCDRNARGPPLKKYSQYENGSDSMRSNTGKTIQNNCTRGATQANCIHALMSFCATCVCVCVEIQGETHFQPHMVTHMRSEHWWSCG